MYKDNKSKKHIEKVKQKSGITLVTLIVTVVVMLILAGVSISDLSNNGGIINRSILATKEFKKQNLIEVVKMAEIYVEMDNQFDRTKQIDIVSLINKVKEISDINERDYIITVDEVEQKATIIDKKMKIVIDIWIDTRGNVTVDGNIVDNIEAIVAPTIEYTLAPPAGTYGEEVTITIVAKESKNGIVKTQFQNNAEKTYNNQKEVKETYTVTENGTYTFTAEGANGRKANAYIEVRNIMSGADITLVAQETKATNQPVDVVITYDENIKIGGATLINADRFQYSIGGSTWQTATQNPITVPVSVNGDVFARYYDGTQGYRTTSLTIANIDREVPVISSATASTSWGTSNSVTIVATDTGSTGCAAGNIGIVGYGINQSSTTEPTYTTVTATTSLSTTINNITANGTYHVWVKDKAGNTANKEVIVSKVDTTDPTTATIASSDVDVETFTLTATGADGESGVAKYEFYINDTLEGTVTTTAGTATYNVTGKTGSTTYTCYVKVYDAVGKTKTSSSITVTTLSPVPPVDIATDASIKVGDFVNYSVTVDGKVYDKWRILHKDTNGHVEIVCYKGPSYTLGKSGDVTKSKSDYANCISLLNTASAPYKNGTYGYSARHLGSNPSNPSSYATISTSYVKFYSGGTIPSGTRAYLEQTHHETDTNALATFSGTNKLSGSYSWLASRRVLAGSSSSGFYVRYVSSGGSVNFGRLCLVNSDGTENANSRKYALAPVVSLQSGIKAIPGSGDGSEDNPWELTWTAPEVVTISQDTTIDYSTIAQYQGKDIKITNNATVTIDGMGQEFNPNITIESGNLIIKDSGLNGKITNNGGTVTLNNCTINNTVQCNSGRIDLYSCTLNGTLDKNGGSIYIDGEPI